MQDYKKETRFHPRHIGRNNTVSIQIHRQRWLGPGKLKIIAKVPDWICMVTHCFVISYSTSLIQRRQKC
jgi:hypothetical protein